jgi:hypothetical protein
MRPPNDLADLFQRFDSAKRGESLSFDDFYRLFSFHEERTRLESLGRNRVHFYFRGAAVSDPLQITLDEASHLFDAIANPDSVDFANIVFCALDVDRVGTLGEREIASQRSLFPAESRIGEMIVKAEKEVEGTTLRLNHVRFVEITTGTVIQANCDPYGNVTKSFCCLLL